MYVFLKVSIWLRLTHLHGFKLLVLMPQFIEITFFHFYQQNKPPEPKLKFRQANNHCKRILEAAKLAYANKTKEFITSQKHGSWDFGEIANSVFNQGKSVILSKLFPENISKNSDHDDVVSLYLFSLLELT